MQCEKCQNELKKEFQFCPNCGHPNPQSEISKGAIPQKKLQPVKAKMDTATKSIIFAGIGWIVPCIGWIFAVIGLVIGFQALSKIKSGEESADNKILAVIALILCFFQIILFFLACLLMLGLGFAVFFANMGRLGY